MLGGLEGFPLDVIRMTVYKNELIVAGEFVQAGNGTGYDMGYYNIARWNGIKWDSLGSGVNAGVSALEVDTINDILYVGGPFTMAGGIPVKYVAKWDGNQWSAVSPLPTKVEPIALKFFNKKLYAGISWSTGGPADTVLMRLDDSGWVPIFGPTGGSVEALEVYNGNLYVGGCFDKVDTTVVNEIACYGDSCPGTPITLTLPYAVNELQVQSLKFKVYPNPAKNNITIETDLPAGQAGENKNFIVRITNPLGQKVGEKKFQKRIEVDVSGFGKGLFLVEVCNEKGVKRHTEKVVVQ